MNNIHISIITLNKNDHLKFLKTLKSIAIQKISFCVEWLILDGSDQNIYKKNKAIIRKELLLKKDFQINHINTNKLNIKGIYPCMNYGKKVSKKSFHFFLIFLISSLIGLQILHIKILLCYE